jgi:hypothetical protein
MEINITTPALIFPAISLLLLAYTNRFQALASVIRVLNQKLEGADNKSLIRQIENLQMRIGLIKAMQALGIASLLGCVVSMLLLFADLELAGRLVFAASLVLMVLSLLVSLWEILLSGNALNIELENLRRRPRG